MISLHEKVFSFAGFNFSFLKKIEIFLKAKYDLQNLKPQNPHEKVADFGGTLSLFLGVSFITIWDNFHIWAILSVLRANCARVANNVNHGGNLVKEQPKLTR